MKCYENERNPATEINKVANRWGQAKKDVEDAKYIEKLIFQDYVRTVRSFKTVWDYRIPMIKAAQSEIGKTKKKERENLSYIEDTIVEEFLRENDKIKVCEIIQGGREGYYWQIHFNFMDGKKVLDKEYVIQIPNRESINTGNFDYAQRGMFAMYERTHPCSIAMMYGEWTPEDIKEKMTAYLNRKEEKPNMW